MFLSLFYLKNIVNWYLKNAIIYFINAKNKKKNLIPVIEVSAVVHLLWNVSTVKVPPKLQCISLYLSSGYVVQIVKFDGATSATYIVKPFRH